MGRQSSRIYFQGKDHKDIYFQGHYHDKMYIGSQLVWEKLKDSLMSKYYTGFPYLLNSSKLYAENGSSALFCDARNAYMTEDFVSMNKVLTVDKHMCGETEYLEYIDGLYCVNGKFFVRTYLYSGSSTVYPQYNGGVIYSSEDGENWNQIDTFIFDTNGFKGTWKLDQRGERIQQITVLNNIAFMYLDGKRTDEYDDSDLVASGNDYTHLLGGLYTSTDFKNWKSVNTHFFMEEVVESGKTKIYYFPHGTYTGSPYIYKDGYYYLRTQTLDTSISDDSEALNNMTEYAFRRTSDLKTTELISVELAKKTIYTFGKYFYVPDQGLTTDFENYISIDGFLSVPQKAITVPQSKARYEFTYTVDESSTYPFYSASETENYIFTYALLSELVASYYYGSSTSPSKTTYKNLRAMLVIDKKDEKNVIDIFPVFYPVYDYETGEIEDQYLFKYSNGIGSYGKPYILSDKEIAGFYTFDSSSNSAILIVGKEI